VQKDADCCEQIVRKDADCCEQIVQKNPAYRVKMFPKILKNHVSFCSSAK
jgi:hypothetical protein